MGDPGTPIPVTRLAVVDDLPYYPEALLPHLRRHRIVVAAVVQRVEDLPRPSLIDVVLCDQRLRRERGLSGPDAIARVVSAGLRVLSTSAVALPDEVLEGIAAGSCGYVSKERPPAEHALAVLEVASTGRYVGSELAGLLLDDIERRPLRRGEPGPPAVEVLRGLAQGDRRHEVCAQSGLSGREFDAVLGAVLRAARRRREEFRLGPRAMEVVELVGCEQLPQQLVARRMGISASAVESHLRRIRERFVQIHPEHRSVTPQAAATLWARLWGMGAPDGPAGAKGRPGRGGPG
jgi:DNA-binding NarL/FixJ family response regulator